MMVNFNKEGGYVDQALGFVPTALTRIFAFRQLAIARRPTAAGAGEIVDEVSVKRASTAALAGLRDDSGTREPSPRQARLTF
ncbi:hypothetical protein [Paraburkholderia sp. J67]|uniref:hypothetical protein n=1 Tax=Paraburkholderia sp. J67 TaxID=2805435 RepID=UPI002ABE16E1|nr:hypothetical protein [Paraburkholderia sp. J67]